MVVGASEGARPADGVTYANPTHVAALFSAMEKSGLRYAVLHGAREIPSRVASDIDVVVDPATFGLLGEFLADFAQQHDGVLCQAIRHEPTACYRVVALPGPDGMPSYLKLDASTDFRRDGRILFGGAELLEETRQVGAVRAVAPGPEFAAYLAKCALKGRISADQMTSLRELWNEDEIGCRAWVGRLLDSERVELVARVMSDDGSSPGGTKDLVALGPRIRRGALRRHPVSTAVYPLRQVARACVRAARRTGVQIALLGPDGVGKSAVNARVGAALEPAFRSRGGLHLRPGLLPPKSGAEGGRGAVVPYQQAPYGGLRSVLKLGYLLVDYIVGYWLLVWPRLVRSTLLVCDRYYLDVVADPRRYRYGGPKGLPAALRRLVPGPDAYVVLIAPVATIQARKSEVAAEQTAAQLAAYEAAAALEPRAIVVDASRELDAVVGDVTDRVLKVMAGRVDRR